MKSLTIISIALLAGLDGFSQENTEVKILAGHSINEYFPPAKRFRYEQFQEGTIYYNLGNGKMSIAGKLNYDFLNGEMLLIKTKEDTVPMVDQKIENFKIGNDTYLNLPDGVFEVIPGTGEIKLCVNSKYILKRTEVISSDGYSSGYDPMRANVTSGKGPSWVTSGPINQNLILKKLITYYIAMDGNAKTFKATRSKIVKNFASKKKEITDYVDLKKTNFSSRVDLEQLVAFLNTMN